MSQSDVHRTLVLSTLGALRRRYSCLRFRVDVQPAPGDPVPPVIGGFRPDIWARSTIWPPHILIAEAKTHHDLDSEHTLAQVAAFVDYLASLGQGRGTFVLAVEGSASQRGHTILRFAAQHRTSSRTRIHLFDGLDFWQLGLKGEPEWRLC